MPLTPMCIVLGHNQIYVHFSSPEISKVCIHLDVHEHPISNGTYCESLDTAC